MSQFPSCEPKLHRRWAGAGQEGYSLLPRLGTPVGPRVEESAEGALAEDRRLGLDIEQ